MIIMIIINTIKKILFFIISIAASTVLLDREKLQEPSLSVSQLYKKKINSTKILFFFLIIVRMITNGNIVFLSPQYFEGMLCITKYSRYLKT